MNNTHYLRNGFILLIAMLPVIYLAYNYNSLPEIVATHFSLDGKADKFGSKKELWFIVILLSGLATGVYFLIKNIYRIDPKRTAKLSVAIFQRISVGLVVFLSAVNILVVYSTITGSVIMTKLIFPFVGLLFVYIGNFMHGLKPNYFVGIRVPWTLENEDNWRATHQFGGKLWFGGGILITICTLIFPESAGIFIFIGGTLLLGLIPVIYSYLYFKKSKQQ
ncbi:MAG TPA: SdpI family protein [Puia sp.]|nr:SdpI family protein [Puia sp.]